MRGNIALLLTVTVLSVACGGGEKRSESLESTISAAPETTSAVTVAPITGTTHEVVMLGDAAGYRYEPSTITASPGDGIRFVVVSGAPHNIAFDPAQIPPEVRAQLWANMGANSQAGSSRILLNRDDEFVLSLGNLPPGRYPFYCTPHLAMKMTGEIIIR